MGILKKSALAALLACSGLMANAATFTVSIPEANGSGHATVFPIAEQSLAAVDFSAHIPAGEVISEVSVNGLFGNSEYPNSAPVIVKVNGVSVAECEYREACSLSQSPTAWTYVFKGTEISALNSGSAVLSYIQTSEYIVRLGVTTLTITTTPKPIEPVAKAPTPVPAVGIPALLASALGIFGAAGFLTRRRKPL